MPQPEGAELEARRRLDQAGIEHPGPIAAWTTARISAAPADSSHRAAAPGGHRHPHPARQGGFPPSCW